MPESGKSTHIQLAPLPVPAPNPALKPIRRPKPPKPTLPHAALVPLFYAALLFLAGIVLARFQYLRPSLLLIGLAPLAAITLLAIFKTPRLTWVPLAAIWLILGLWSAETESQPSPDPAITALADGLLRTVEGTVTDAGPIRAAESEDQDADDPDPTSPIQRNQLTQRIDLQLTAAEVVTDATDTILPIPTRPTARIRLTLQWPIGAPSPLQCGQQLRAILRILPADDFHDPGIWSRESWLESQQISAIARLNALQQDSGQPRLTLLGQPANSANCLLNRWRNLASSRLATLPVLTNALPRPLRASPEDAAMLTALLTGDRTFLTRSLRIGFERTGSFHLIVVSGLHLAILAGWTFALARRLRIPRVPATVLTLAFSLAYAFFTGFGVPVQRSFWMITLYLLGRLLYRNRSPLNVLGFATLCLAAASPRSIFDASLQMTILAVAAIAGIALPLLDRTLHARIQATRNLRLIVLDAKLPNRVAQFRVTVRLLAQHLERAANYRIAWQLLPLLARTILRVAELLFVTLIVELALALPMAMYFHRITVTALPVNLLILPLLGLLVPSAFLPLLILAVWPSAKLLAMAPAALTLSILHLSVYIVRKLGSLTLADLRIPNPAHFQIALALMLFVLALQLARNQRKSRRLSFAALALMAIVALWPRSIDHPSSALLFEAIDVGQGDSLLLITPDGKTLLIDAGGLGFQSPKAPTIHSEFDIGEEVVSAVLWSRGIRRLDAVALTHAHHDHMGGLPAILRNFHPRELWIGNNPPIPAYTAILQQARTLGAEIRILRAGQSLSLGAASFRVLAPSASYEPGPQPANNDSLVLQARYQNSAILLAGDAESPEENSILAESSVPESSLTSTLLKVGHHGSLTSTKPAFLARVAPAWAVISCGRRNRFGHPRPEILAELQAAHTHTFRTDLTGAACFLLDGKSVQPQPLCAKEPNLEQK